MPTHYQGGKEEKLSLDLFIKLLRASNSVIEAIRQHLREEKITTSQFAVLEALYYLGEMPQRSISKKILKTEGNLTLVIKNLEKKGYIKRKTFDKDKRVNLISLTPAGKKWVERYFPGVLKLIMEIFSDLSIEEKEELNNLLRKVGFKAKELKKDIKKYD